MSWCGTPFRSNETSGFCSRMMAESFKQSAIVSYSITPNRSYLNNIEKPLTCCLFSARALYCYCSRKVRDENFEITGQVLLSSTPNLHSKSVSALLGYARMPTQYIASVVFSYDPYYKITAMKSANSLIMRN